MAEDIDDLRKWMALPETNTAVMQALFGEYMADPNYIAEMKVQTLLWSQVDERSC